jgi:hypothetical protein
MSDVGRNIGLIQSFAADNGYRVFWRGQANHEWGLLSSLVRKLSAVMPVDDTLLNKVEDAIITEASGWIDDLKKSLYSEPLAKLIYLQHHGLPTRVLDFTADPWMAVFFAAESLDYVDGRLFAILVEASEVLTSVPADTPWRKGSTSKLLVFDPVGAGISFPRLRSQSGVGVLGRLPSTQPHREAHDEVLGHVRSLLAEEVRRILSIPFKLVPFSPTDPSAPISASVRAPFGLTFRLHVDKGSVRRELAGSTRGRRTAPRATVNHNSVYPDAAGMTAHSAVIRGLEKGVLVI